MHESVATIDVFISISRRRRVELEVRRRMHRGRKGLAGELDEGRDLLQKPYRHNDLLLKVREVLDQG